MSLTGSPFYRTCRCRVDVDHVLVNLIAETMISQPKHIDAMYERLPESKRQAIEKRDAKKD